MATPIINEDYEALKKETYELIAAGGCLQPIYKEYQGTGYEAELNAIGLNRKEVSHD
jgi:hypothetical protein